MILKYDKSKNKLIITESERIEYNQVKLWLNRYVKGYRFTPAFKRGVWDGKIDNFKNGVLPVGLWKEIALSLQEIGKKLKIENTKDFPLNREINLENVEEFCRDFFKDHYILEENQKDKKDFFPYEHQIQSAFSILRNRYCTAEIATSGGKSLIISIVFLYILRNINPEAKLLLIVPSITLVTQFYDDIMNYNYGFNKENKNPVDLRIQEIMSDKPRQWHGDKEPNLVISTYQSLSKVNNFGKKFYRDFYGVACDEAHMAKSDSFVKILKRTGPYSYYQFGLSGTFQDDGYAEFITIQSLTGPKVNKVKAKELQEKGFISKVRISQIHLNHDDYEFRDRLKEIKKNPDSGALAYRLEGDYIRESKKRMDFINKLMKSIKNNTLILFNIIDYGYDLRDSLEEYFQDEIRNGKLELHMIYGEVKKDEREQIKEKMELNDGVVRILLATYGTLSTGVSIKNIHNIVFSEGFRSEQRVIQSIGRSLRLYETKNVASIYDLVDVFSEENSNNVLLRHGFDRLKLYKKHEYPFKVKKFLL